MCKDNANERRISSLLEYFAECSLSSAKILIFFYFMAFSLAFSPFSRKKVKI